MSCSPAHTPFPNHRRTNTLRRSLGDHRQPLLNGGHQWALTRSTPEPPPPSACRP